MVVPTNRNQTKKLHQRFDELDREVFSAFCGSFKGVQWAITPPNDDDFSGIDLQATGTTKMGKTKTYDIELKAVFLNSRKVNYCFFQPDKWLSLVQYENDNKMYFVIYPHQNRIAIWNINRDLLRRTPKTIELMNKNTANNSDKVKKQVYMLSLNDAKIYEYNLT